MRLARRSARKKSEKRKAPEESELSVSKKSKEENTLQKPTIKSIPGKMRIVQATNTSPPENAMLDPTQWKITGMTQIVENPEASTIRDNLVRMKRTYTNIVNEYEFWNILSQKITLSQDVDINQSLNTLIQYNDKIKTHFKRFLSLSKYIPDWPEDRRLTRVAKIRALLLKDQPENIKQFLETAIDDIPWFEILPVSWEEMQELFREWVMLSLARERAQVGIGSWDVDWRSHGECIDDADDDATWLDYMVSRYSIWNMTRPQLLEKLKDSLKKSNFEDATKSVLLNMGARILRREWKDFNISSPEIVAWFEEPQTNIESLENIVGRDNLDETLRDLANKYILPINLPPEILAWFKEAMSKSLLETILAKESLTDILAEKSSVQRVRRLAESLISGELVLPESMVPILPMVKNNRLIDFSDYVNNVNRLLSSYQEQDIDVIGAFRAILQTFLAEQTLLWIISRIKARIDELESQLTVQRPIRISRTIGQTYSVTWTVKLEGPSVDGIEWTWKHSPTGHIEDEQDVSTVKTSNRTASIRVIDGGTWRVQAKLANGVVAHSVVAEIQVFARCLRDNVLFNVNDPSQWGECTWTPFSETMEHKEARQRVAEDGKDEDGKALFNGLAVMAMAEDDDFVPALDTAVYRFIQGRRVFRFDDVSILSMASMGQQTMRKRFFTMRGVLQNLQDQWLDIVATHFSLEYAAHIRNVAPLPWFFALGSAPPDLEPETLADRHWYETKKYDNVSKNDKNQSLDARNYVSLDSYESQRTEFQQILYPPVSSCSSVSSLPVRDFLDAVFRGSQRQVWSILLTPSDMRALSGWMVTLQEWPQHARMAQLETLITTRDWDVDRRGETAFWERVDRAKARRPVPESLGFDQKEYIIGEFERMRKAGAPFGISKLAWASASIRRHANPGAKEYVGVHSHTSTQPTTYQVDEANRRIIVRASEPRGIGYDFGGIHRVIENHVRGSRESATKKESDRHWAHAMHWIRVFGVLAEFGPTLPVNVTLSVEDIARLAPPPS